MAPFDTSMPTPAQPAPAPAAMAPPNVAQPDPTNPQAPPSVGTSPRPALPKGTQPTQDPNAAPGSVEPHHGVLASIFQDLAGGQKTTWRQTDKGPVPVKENLKPGEMARSILAAAITGLAGGYAAPRGKGPAAAEAFGAGFQAEQEQRDQTQKKAQTQAQQEFKNQQEADELTLRKHVDAREQQESLQRFQLNALKLEEDRKAAERGDWEFAQERVKADRDQAGRLNLLRQVGGSPLTFPDGTPIPEFNSAAEAGAWANKNPKLALQPGKYNTVIETDPDTGRATIYKKPVGWDDPQWLGVKKGADGTPVRGTNGDFVPDGSFKDASGKVVAPAGMMTPHQMYDSQIRLLDLQSKELTRQEALERLKSAKLQREKDQQQNAADEQFNRAQGDPDAVDPVTHQFIVSPSSRTILQQRFIKDGAMQSSILQATQKELDQIRPSGQILQKYQAILAKGPKASKADKQWLDDNRPDIENYIERKKDADDAQQNLHQIQLNMMKLGRTPNIADVMAANLRKQFTTPDGIYNEQGALKSAEALQGNAGLKQSIRDRLTSDYGMPKRTPDQIAKVASDLADMGLTPGDEEAYINSIGESSTTKQGIRDQLKAMHRGSSNESENENENGAETGEGSVAAVQAIGRGVAGAAKRVGKFIGNTPVEPVAAQ